MPPVAKEARASTSEVVRVGLLPYRSTTLQSDAGCVMRSRSPMTAMQAHLSRAVPLGQVFKPCIPTMGSAA